MNTNEFTEQIPISPFKYDPVYQIWYLHNTENTEAVALKAFNSYFNSAYVDTKLLPYIFSEYP